ncbi:MAG: hypothetical protein GY718_04575 [Lentisphaerae bacterium]|nr:hypothetical protein [Lentisphaerota bacterium]
MIKLIDDTFNRDLDRLPTKDHIVSLGVGGWNITNFLDQNKIRRVYTENSFVILNHDFLVSVRDVCDNLHFDNIAELNSGVGWFTWWARKYDIPIQDCVDNMTCPFYRGKYMDHVRRCNSVRFVGRSQDVQLFILSWPYVDNIAFRVWKKMIPGQYLLYIGEHYGGCTANEDFFDSVSGCEIEDQWGLTKNFLSFDGIHDQPELYRK